MLLGLAAIGFISFAAFTYLTRAETVTGQVVNVESASVTTVATLTLRDDAGKEWTFTGAGVFAGFTPSHLEEHRALLESVTVEYEVSDSGDLIILGLSD